MNILKNKSKAKEEKENNKHINFIHSEEHLDFKFFCQDKMTSYHFLRFAYFYKMLDGDLTGLEL